MNLSEAEIYARLQRASPSFSTDGYADGPQIETLKCAAVLVPLLQQGGEWHLLFTRRTDQVESHKNQVSFPGGACDEGETTPEETALREAYEELGLPPQSVRVLGRLAPLITITAYRVTPVVGIIPWPLVLRPATMEVARVFTIPLAWLADPSNRWEFYMPGREHSLIVYHPFDGELLWGATARITVNLIEVLAVSP